MTERYIRDVLKTVIAQICQTIGWHSIQSTSLEITIDVLHRYLFEIAKLTHRYSEQFGQTQPNLDHLGLAFRDMHINISELEEYVQYVESVPCVYDVPKLPVPRESHLNFLKPGSQEVVTRPVYVHEHLPPMYPELEAEERNSVLPPVDGGTSNNSIQILPESPEEPENVFKRPGDPISDNSMAKRAKMSLGEEGRPTREISSVMMTSSGFLSPAREGKLPEARTPQNLSDCPTPSPLYPAVPPEVRMEKKIKKMLDIKKKECINKELFKPDKNITTSDDTKAKKLANMKEMAKLKALKSGAVKMGFNTEPLNIIPSSLPYKLQSDQKLPKMTQAIPKIEDVTIEPPIQEHQITGKLSAEPDRLKLNIFKKISSKVKDEKVDKLDKVKTESVDHGFSREIAPGLFLTEISPVKHDKSQKDEKSRIINPTIKEEITCTQTVITKVNQPISPNIVKSPRSDKDYIHDVDLSPPNTPGTPSTPKTPELTIITPPRKVEKEKRKRKECARLKVKEPKTKTPKQIQRKMKAVKHFTEMPRPKTPEGLVNFIKPPELLVPPNMFPIFQSFSGGPGLIPPPMGHPFLGLPFPPRGLPVGHGFGQPPTLAQRPVVPIPNPIQMRMPKADPPPTAPPEPRIEPVTVTPAVEVKEEPAVLVQERPKPAEVIKEKSEKKSKEHKKEKKEKAKLRKKREKKDKIKSKDKAEKKREKEEKKEREKLTKIKKEKKEKHKEKEREQESVPKLTLKLGPSCVPSPDPTQMSRKITIKPVTKKSDDDKATPVAVPNREPSPELARISALVTRPPKSNKAATKEEKDTVQKAITPKTTAGPGRPRGSTNKAASNAGNPTLPISVAETKPSNKPGPSASVTDKDGNKVWICPACGSQDDGSPMIGCDDCDAWYHWVCVGIQVPPDDNEDWYCRVCIVKKQETLSSDKKKKRKKKDKKEH